LKYKYASVVGGNTRSQYSMDENTDGNFRVVTSNWINGKNNSNVYIVGTDGKVAGKLENIAPGEQFYGVRFVGNYLYLVTYRQVDPLFVIDTTNAAKPVVVGELKMP
jgi:inhibitor of cysteine peptidase